MNPKISHREFEIVENVCLGLSKKEVADRLYRSPRTIETTIRNVYEKLGFSKVQDLTLWYVGQKFNLSIEIEQLKKTICVSVFLLLVSFETFAASDDFLRGRRVRVRKVEDVEILE